MAEVEDTRRTVLRRLSRVRTTQPQVATDVTPIKRDLLWVFNAAAPGPMWSRYGTVDDVVRAEGVAGATSSTTNDLWIADRPLLPHQWSCTFACIVKIPTLTGGCGLMVTNGSGGSYKGLNVQVTAAGYVNGLVGNGGSATSANRNSFTGTTNPIAAGETVLIVAVARGQNDAFVYVNGQSQTLTYSGTASTMSLSTAVNGALGRQAGNGATAGKEIFGAWMVDRALTENEVPKTFADFWSYFAPQTETIQYAERQVWSFAKSRMLGTSTGTPATVAIQTSKSRVWTSQPQEVVGANPAFNPSHLWAQNVYGSRAIRDSAGNADGVFGSGSGGTTGNIWRLDADGYYIEYNDAGTGTTNSKILNVGNASGSGGSENINLFSVVARIRVASGEALVHGGTNFSFRRLGIDGTLALVKQTFGVVAASTGTVPDGVTTDVGVSWDGVTAHFYINGVLDAVVAGTNTASVKDQKSLGASSATKPVNGYRMYRCALFDSVLSPSAFATLSGSGFWQLFATRKSLIWTGVP